MGLTITNPLSPVPNQVEGNKRKSVRNCQFDSSYATGGEVLTPADFGLRQVDYATTTPVTTGTNAGGTSTGQIAAFNYNTATQKLLVYDGDSESASVNLSDLVVRVEAVGY